MLTIFHTLIYQPLYNLLIWLYSIAGDLGIAIILLTIIIKTALIPLAKKQIASQRAMAELQPQIKELQEKHKDNMQERNQAIMNFYKEHNINPAAGCLPLIFQIIIFLGIYRIIFNLADRDEFKVVVEDLYGFVPRLTEINSTFVNLIDLSVPNYVLAVITAVVQWWQIKMMMNSTPQPAKKEGEQPDFAQVMQKQMLIMIPIMTLGIGIFFPAGLTLYWLVSALFMVGQQYYTIKSTQKDRSTA